MLIESFFTPLILEMLRSHFWQECTFFLIADCYLFQFVLDWLWIAVFQCLVVFVGEE